MKKNDLKILRFPNSISNLERQVEAILFAAEEPLDQESIQEKLKTRTDISKILDSLKTKIEQKEDHLIMQVLMLLRLPCRILYNQKYLIRLMPSRRLFLSKSYFFLQYMEFEIPIGHKKRQAI